jgi:hypothetical protein
VSFQGVVQDQDEEDLRLLREDLERRRAGQPHASHQTEQLDVYAEYDTASSRNQRMQADGGQHHGHVDESHALLYEHLASESRDAHTQPEHEPVGAGTGTEAGELPPEESLRIHKLRRRPPPPAAAIDTDPAYEQETLS